MKQGRVKSREIGEGEAAKANKKVLLVLVCMCVLGRARVG